MRLSDERYEEIKKIIANFLEDYNVRKLPINVFELAEKMKIKIVFASKLLLKFPKKISEYTIFSYPNSYLIYNPHAQQFVIYIDNIGTKKEKAKILSCS